LLAGNISIRAGKTVSLYKEELTKRFDLQVHFGHSRVLVFNGGKKLTGDALPYASRTQLYSDIRLTRLSGSSSLSYFEQGSPSTPLTTQLQSQSYMLGFGPTGLLSDHIIHVLGEFQRTPWHIRLWSQGGEVALQLELKSAEGSKGELVVSSRSDERSLGKWQESEGVIHVGIQYDEDHFLVTVNELETVKYMHKMKGELDQLVAIEMTGRHFQVSDKQYRSNIQLTP